MSTYLEGTKQTVYPHPLLERIKLICLFPFGLPDTVTYLAMTLTRHYSLREWQISISLAASSPLCF